jgi:hypothetical protein
LSCITISLILGVAKSITAYLNGNPQGLEEDSKVTHRVVILKKPFWEYKLASLLLHDRLNKIDARLEGLLSGKASVQITKSLSLEEYISWLKLRPTNLLNMVTVAKNLLIFELSSSIGGEKTGSLEIRGLVKLSDQIKNLYEAAYLFEIEGKQIDIPEGFNVIHEIQSAWVVVIRDGINQMFEVLDQISKRTAKDVHPINANIVFEEPPRIKEFEEELERLSDQDNYLI